MSDFSYQMAVLQQAAQGDLSAIDRIYPANAAPVPQAPQPTPQVAQPQSEAKG